MNNKKIPTCLGTAILVVIAITAGAFVWVYEKNQGLITTDVTIQNMKKASKALSLQESTITAPSFPEMDLGDWQTYTDNKFGYTVKYPRGYVVHKYLPPCTAKQDDTNGTNIIFKNASISNASEDVRDKIFDFDIFVDDPKDTCILNYYSSIGGPQAQVPKLLKSETIVLNKYRVLKRTYSHLDPSGNQSLFQFSTWRFENNNKFYTLMFNNGTALTDTEHQNDTFENFLKNFIFE